MFYFSLFLFCVLQFEPTDEAKAFILPPFGIVGQAMIVKCKLTLREDEEDKVAKLPFLFQARTEKTSTSPKKDVICRIDNWLSCAKRLPNATRELNDIKEDHCNCGYRTNQEPYQFTFFYYLHNLTDAYTRFSCALENVERAETVGVAIAAFTDAPDSTTYMCESGTIPLIWTVGISYNSPFKIRKVEYQLKNSVFYNSGKIIVEGGKITSRFKEDTQRRYNITYEGGRNIPVLIINDLIEGDSGKIIVLVFIEPEE
ncbi:uncharacterized protein LOC131941370 [Physella acuta]|uniref:uncharacterized protein LOC131941370 n=1 Tax=Physella acuta TaxID=109671 RepID=UPI0027DE2344|nr:uncharacterized protein LOC131941370 [Physella acuta]